MPLQPGRTPILTKHAVSQKPCPPELQSYRPGTNTVNLENPRTDPPPSPTIGKKGRHFAYRQAGPEANSGLLGSRANHAAKFVEGSCSRDPGL